MSEPVEVFASAATARGLRESHARLEAAFNDLSERARSGDWHECDEIWDWFSRDIEAHLVLEEERLFPAWEQSGEGPRVEAAALRRQHQIIREQLVEIGVALQLHEVSAERIERFVEELRRHAHHEDETLHAWLEAEEAAGR